MDLLLASAGLVLLLASGDLLVRGAVALSLRLGIPALIVGLTVVSLGTSAPELLVSVQAVLRGVPGLALGNVVGSNIANMLLVLGLPALIAAIDASRQDARRSYAMMFAATVVAVGLCLGGPLGALQGAVLLTLLALVLADMVRAARQERAGPGAPRREAIEEVESIRPPRRLWRILALLAVGLVGLPLGADMLIDGATAVAGRIGISDAVIGLTLVAVGTSLPELATTVVAAVRGRVDVAFGNVIGSNIFNLLGILGVASLFGPVPVAPELIARDLWVMLAATLVLLPVVLRGWRITRAGGGLFLIAYGGYVWMLFH